jgi:hypothetical protein
VAARSAWKIRWPVRSCGSRSGLSQLVARVALIEAINSPSRPELCTSEGGPLHWPRSCSELEGTSVSLHLVAPPTASGQRYLLLRTTSEPAVRLTDWNRFHPFSKGLNKRANASVLFIEPCTVCPSVCPIENPYCLGRAGPYTQRQARLGRLTRGSVRTYVVREKPVQDWNPSTVPPAREPELNAFLRRGPSNDVGASQGLPGACKDWCGVDFCTGCPPPPHRVSGTHVTG